MLLVTTRTTSKRLLAPTRSSESDVGSVRVRDGCVVRQCDPALLGRRGRGEVWVTRSTAEFFKRDNADDNAAAFRAVRHADVSACSTSSSSSSSTSTGPLLHLQRLVASAWLQPRGCDFKKTCVTHTIDATRYELDADNIALMPSRGNARDVEVSLLRASADSADDGAGARGDPPPPDEALDFRHDLSCEGGTCYAHAASRRLFVFTILAEDNGGNGGGEEGGALREATPLRDMRGGSYFALPSGRVEDDDALFASQSQSSRASQASQASRASSQLSATSVTLLSHVLEDGIDDMAALRKAISSRASEASLLFYVYAAIQKAGCFDARLWKRCTTPAMRYAVTELAVDHLESCLLTDLFGRVEEEHDLALVGKSRARCFFEMRVVLFFLKHFEANSLAFPKDW